MSELGFAGRIADRLIDSTLVPLIVVGTLIAGAWGLALIPREDRPNIEVPTARIVVPSPGAGVQRVDELIARPVSAWARQLEQVVEVNSVASSDAAVVEVEFVTGLSDAEAYSLLSELVASNAHRLPRSAGPAEIRTLGDEILTGLMITLSSGELDGAALHRIGDELAVELEQVPGVRNVEVFGGQPRQIQVRPDPVLLAARGIGLVELSDAIEAASLRLPAEPIRGPVTRSVRVGTLPAAPADLRQIQVGVGPAGIVYLGDVADVVDGPAPFESASLHWQRDRNGDGTDAAMGEVPAVSLALTSVPNANISTVTERALARVDRLAGELLPSSVEVTTAYDAGAMATDTVISVLENFAIAAFTVIAIIFLGLGWRAAAGVSLQLPSSLAIVPIAYLWLDFTLNPVSIAAMILAIGLLADDNVIIMENIRRHFGASGRRSREVAVRAVDEVGNPTMIAVFLIIATFLPTAFITGEMGQYTRAIPIGTSLAIGFSLVIALTVTPYVAYRILRPPSSRSQASAANGDDAGERGGDDGDNDVPTGRWADFYRAMLRPLFDRAPLRWAFYLGLLGLFLASIAMVGLRAVQLTLVPTLDRDVFVIELELPPGSPLEETVSAASAVGRQLRDDPDIEGYTVFAGADGPLLLPPPGPPELPRATAHRASLYVQLHPQRERARQSFEISRELAFSTLPGLLERWGARAWIRSIPSGPSSDNDLQAELFGDDVERRDRLADTVARLFEQHEAVGAIERFPKPAGPELRLEVDLARAAARGVPPARVAAAVQIALTGREATRLDLPAERRPLPVVVRLDPALRDRTRDLEGLYVRSESGQSVPLPDLVTMIERPRQAAVHRHEQLPTVIVAGRVDRERSQPISVQRDIVRQLEREPVVMPEIRWIGLPSSDRETTLYWGGEWAMTQQVYRDLAVAGLVVVMLIYLVLAGWFGSYSVPLLIMIPIPLVFIGVIPGHWIAGLDIAGLGVLGVIALAGIVVRNALLLVDFTRLRLDQGMALRDALISAGVVRTRPILLTAGTVVLGSGALVFEPALKPLGVTLVSGVLVSTLLTLVLIPALYFHMYGEANDA
ncbi:efflux RND transporter permease subunit [Wenzhouxiangella sp. XN79A]|uniref:efflux RND transporter permease subunit n=1 Tax=Wenzhouxiangella sp. XN79A TaxID=2724193 RepID=UPI00144A5464|nr:efflux RND transporter permease subunit [Wenzhouxiangella sp. XN79A]NKI35584.1 efflux RND transporter permease subunit [Wenzhouxiangella sp. XN79A]